MTTQFDWHEYRASEPRHADGWASSDRGWLHLVDHPLGRDYSACGNYLDYGHGAYKGNPSETIHAMAYYFHQLDKSSIASRTLGEGWFASITDARTWIEQTVQAFLDKRQEV